jgi:hypothetical protein
LNYFLLFFIPISEILCLVLVSRFKMKSFGSLLLVLSFGVIASNAQFRFQSGGGTFFNRGRPQVAQPAQQGFRQGGGGGGCTPTANYQSGGRNFWVSWRTCGTQYEATQIQGACASGGMRPVSLNDPALAQEFMNLAAQEGQKWFWTGGRVSGQTITWPNGVSQNANQLRSLFSHTGGCAFYL